MQTFTGIWQAEDPIEKDWIEEVFAGLISSYVTDGRHQLVLDDAILFDAFCSANDPAYYAQFRGRNAFLVHFLDETYEGGYEIYDNFRGVIRCFWADVFNPARVMPLALGYLSGTEINRPSITLASERKYVWSFLGGMAKSSRPDMARELVAVQPNFCFATDAVPGFEFYNRRQDGSARQFPRKEYSEFLFESTFSPCPMGNVNLECFRVYESLEAGAIPIVERRLTLDYFTDLLGPHPMPTVRSWAEARRLVTSMLRQPAQLDVLQAECMQWWKRYKSAYKSRLADFLATQPPSGSPLAAPPMLPGYRRPGWKIREMIRHHDTRSLARRVQRQAARILSTGATREAFRPGHADTKASMVGSSQTGHAESRPGGDSMNIQRVGTQASAKGPDEYFTGSVRVDMLFKATEPGRSTAANVTFEPGARTAWHTHPLGQGLLIVAGCGWVQREGEQIEEVHPGDAVWFGAGEKHWHGATPTTGMTHIAITESLAGKLADWLEKVTDDQYRK